MALDGSQVFVEVAEMLAMDTVRVRLYKTIMQLQPSIKRFENVRNGLLAAILLCSGGVTVMAENHGLRAEMRPLRLLILGASTSAYRGDLNIAAFQVSDALSRRGVRHLFFNSGVGGNTTHNARSRFARDVLDLYPDIVFILLGTNDSMLDVFRGITTPRVSPEEYAKNLRFFAKELRHRDVQPVFLTIQPLYMTDRLRAQYGRPPYTEKGFNFMVDQYVNLIKQVAAEEHVPCLDINHKFWDAAENSYDKLPAFYSDGMHPNPRGQSIIAEAMLDWLDADPALLKWRSPYGDRALHLDVDQPVARTAYETGRVPLRLRPPRRPALVQYRLKPYSGDPRDFGQWVNVDFVADAEDAVTGTIPVQADGRTYAFQFRTLDADGNPVSLGGVDHVKASALTS